jgi:hypothetical protein
MNSLLIGFLGGAAAFFAPRLASMMARIVVSGGERLKAFLTTLDDKAEEKTGLHIPEWAHQAYDGAVTRAVGFAEGAIGTKEFWQQVFFILRGQPDKYADRMLSLLAGIDWSKGLDQALPPEVKTLVNDAKQAVAVTQVRASIATLPEHLKPTEEKLVADVAAMAPAAGKTLAAEQAPVKSDDLQARIAETKRKLLEHAATLEAKK